MTSENRQVKPVLFPAGGRFIAIRHSPCLGTMNPIIQAAAAVTAIGSIGSGALYLDHAHVASEDFDRYLAKERVGTIFDYLDQIRASGPEPWLCGALHEELIELCVDLPEHVVCKGRDDIIEKAGCDD